MTAAASGNSAVRAVPILMQQFDPQNVDEGVKHQFQHSPDFAVRFPSNGRRSTPTSKVGFEGWGLVEWG